MMLARMTPPIIKVVLYPLHLTVFGLKVKLYMQVLQVVLLLQAEQLVGQAPQAPVVELR
jgi:hypothetical protein